MDVALASIARSYWPARVRASTHLREADGTEWLSLVRTKRVWRLVCVPKCAEAESSFLSANAVVSLGYIVSIDEVL